MYSDKTPLGRYASTSPILLLLRSPSNMARDLHGHEPSRMLYTTINYDEAIEELFVGDLCDNIGLVLAYLPSGAMSLHYLAVMTQPSLSCLKLLSR